jgi:hypothetical protein
MEGALKTSKPSDSSDVTLACKFHQSGHCKFGDKCRKLHTKNTCSEINCSNSTCSARHPKPCLYFTKFGACKFGTKCSYLHCDLPSNNTENKIAELKASLDSVITALENKEKEINLLEQRISSLESSKSEEVFSCDHCDFKTFSSSGLKSHTTTKH